MTARTISAAAVIMIVWIFMSPVATAGPSENIRVGLMFDTTALPAVRISSASGIEFGCNGEDGFVELYTHISGATVSIRKEGYFVQRNGALVEVGSEGIIFADTVFGPYHLQVSGAFRDKRQAEKVIQDITDEGVEGYLSYDGEWRVWVGRYPDEGEMERQNGYLKDKLKGLYDIYPVSHPKDVLQLNDDHGNVLFMFEGAEMFLISRPIDGECINVEGKRYRGNIEFRRQKEGNITVVNSLPLQHYLYGVVPKEVSPSWHKEVLKAQAVAARNFAVVNRGKHGQFGFDVCSGTDCQVYGGFDSENPLTNDAVDETAGRMIYYEGKPITAYYHASSGGYTESSENVWNISLPYIQAVHDSFDADSPHDSWQKVYTSEQITDILASHGINIGNVRDIRIDSRTPTGRSLALTIQGSRGSTVLEKEKSRAVFGYNELKSTFFTVETDGDFFVLNKIGMPVERVAAIDAIAINYAGTVNIREGSDTLIINNGRDYASVNKYPTKFIFNGKGWGHGLGMSQWGAKGMAEAGYSYTEILRYYYQGCVIE